MKRLIAWFKKYWLAVGAIFLLCFIPLYPKIPVLPVIRTWVYIRLEDFLTALLFAGFFFSLVRKRKFLPDSPLTIPISTYWAVGLASGVFSLLFIGPHLMGYFPHLVILHYLRRIEYMMLFFVAFYVLKDDRNILKAIIWSLTGTVAGVIFYGFGQKLNWGFPAFLTMNEEFAKGIPLRLPPTARIPSTFGGHYDLAAFLVLVIPIFGSLIFGAKAIWQKILFFIMTVFSLVLLLFTASRVSFGVYLIVISVMLFWNKKKLLIIPAIIGSIFLLKYVSGTADRFYKTIRTEDVIIDLQTGKPIAAVGSLEGLSAVVKPQERPDVEQLPIGTGGYIKVPTTTSVPAKSLNAIEIYTNKDLASGSGEVATISGSFLVEKALVYDISITTRFQGQWPKAIQAFKRNIFLGSGYSTLSLAADGDYHRMLGETGLLGTVSFLGILAMAFAQFFWARDSLSKLEKAFVVGVFAGIVGLLLNAVLIDVFEASKVAFTLWLLLGFAVGLLSVKKPPIPYFKFLWKIFTHKIAFVVYLTLITFFVLGNALKLYFLGDDFTWLRWAAVSTIRDVGKYFTDAQGFFYRPIPKVWYYVLFSLFWLKPLAYHLASIALFAISMVTLYAIMIKLKLSKVLVWLFALLYIVLSVHHENIYWISGQSSLLAGTFLLLSIYTFMQAWSGTKKRELLLFFGGMVFLLLSMGSYDGMMIAPAIVAVIGLLLYRKRFTPVLLLVFIPLYWWVRTKSGAVPLEGDYGYNLSALLVNTLGNSSGYLATILAGPRALEAWEQIRTMIKIYKMQLSLVITVLGIILALVMFRLRKHLTEITAVLAWLLCFILALLPYLGLGGMAERYAFVASGFLVIALATTVDLIWKSFPSLGVKVATVAVILGLVWWNYGELKRVEGDWQKASDISTQALSGINKQFFPLKEKKTFIFVNVPIRYGRAWVFPTGLNDALWHMFREAPFKVVQVSTVPEAFHYPVGITTWDVLVFDNYVLKRTVMDVKPLDENLAPNQ